MKRRLLVTLYWLLSNALVQCSTDDAVIPEIQLSTPASITHLRKVQLSDNLKFGNTAIKGIIISDINAGNVDNNIIAIQEEGRDAAILVELNDSNTLPVNTEVQMDISGSQLVEEKGELKIKNISSSKIVPTGKTVVITPKPTSLSSIAAEAKYWGPILVRLENLALSGGEGGLMNGTVSLNDGITSQNAYFDPSSAFAQVELPEVAQTFIGVVRLDNDKVYVNPRNIDDVQAQANEVIEDFEDATNTSYDVKSIAFRTGSWIVDGGITASTSADLKTGSQSIRLQGTTTNDKRNGILAMEFDLKGVKRMKISHGIYPASAEKANVNPTTLDIEVSKDGGATYTFLKQVEVDITSTVLLTDEIAVNAGKNENVRFRVVNSSTPFSNNNRPRINIDDIVFEY